MDSVRIPLGSVEKYLCYSGIGSRRCIVLKMISEHPNGKGANMSINPDGAVAFDAVAQADILVLSWRSLLMQLYFPSKGEQALTTEMNVWR